MHQPLGRAVPDVGNDESSRAIDEAVRRFRAGIERESSFRFLVERYAQTVHQFFRQRGVGPEDAHDLTQETFLAIYRGLESFRGEARFGTWVFAIALNTLRRNARHHDRPPAVRIAASPHNDTDSEVFVPVDQRPRADQTLLETEARERLRNAVAELPWSMRHCLMLRIYRELSYRQISETLGVSVPAVKTRLFQARQRLHQSLGANLGDLPR
ncbi:MAG: sigma-70 family RNA polymerase sigma factor [Acidobacteriota bacterium]